MGAAIKLGLYRTFDRFNVCSPGPILFLFIFKFWFPTHVCSTRAVGTNPLIDLKPRGEALIIFDIKLGSRRLHHLSLQVLRASPHCQNESAATLLMVVPVGVDNRTVLLE